MMDAEKIPLEVLGVMAGTAIIREDGTISLEMDAPNIFGQEILLQIRRGLVKGLAISVVTEPTRQPFLDHPSIYFTDRDGHPRNLRRDHYYPPTT